LVETLLTIGALSALSLGIYMVLKPTSASAQAKIEHDNLRDLSTSVNRSSASCSTPSDVGNVRYQHLYTHSAGIGGGMDGGGTPTLAWTETISACVSACEAGIYEPGRCEEVNGHSNYGMYAIPKRTEDCPSGPGTRTWYTAAACNDLNGPLWHDPQEFLPFPPPC
jgi:hypothetical protein